MRVARSAQRADAARLLEIRAMRIVDQIGIPERILLLVLWQICLAHVEREQLPWAIRAKYDELMGKCS
jgi:hypothetical protein